VFEENGKCTPLIPKRLLCFLKIRVSRVKSKTALTKMAAAVVATSRLWLAVFSTNRQKTKRQNGFLWREFYNSSACAAQYIYIDTYKRSACHGIVRLIRDRRGRMVLRSAFFRITGLKLTTFSVKIYSICTCLIYIITQGVISLNGTTMVLGDT